MGHAIVAGGKPDMAAPVTGILASDLAVGSVVKLMENGVATEYLMVNQGKPSGSSLYDDSCDGTWLLRKDIKENRQWHSSNVNDYQNSTIHAWLNGDFFNLFGSIEQVAIKQVKIPYVNGTGSGGSVASGSNGLSTKVFLLGGYEIGFTESVSIHFPVDGAKLDYFESGSTNGGTNRTKRIAYLNGSAARWWLRSPDSRSNTDPYFAASDGDYSSLKCSYSYGIRPALVLPSSALFDTNTLILKGVA